MTNTAELTDFQRRFHGDARQLGMRLAGMIEDFTPAGWVTKNLEWGEGEIGKVFDGYLIPTESQFRQVIEFLKDQKAVVGSDLSVLREFWNERLEAKLSAAEGEQRSEVPAQAVAEAQASVVPEVLQQVLASPAPAEAEVASETPGSELTIEWSPDGSSVIIGGQVFDLTSANKSLRNDIWKCLEQLKGGWSWQKLADESGESTMSTFSNLKIANTGVTRDRAERWAKALGISIPTLFGIKVDKNPEASSIFAEAEAPEAEAVKAISQDDARKCFLEWHQGGELNERVTHALLTAMFAKQEPDYKALGAAEMLAVQDDGLLAKLLKSEEHLSGFADVTLQQIFDAMRDSEPF